MKRILSIFTMLSVILTMWAQRQVKGIVTDSESEPLIGATVKIDGGTERMVTTDVDGRFLSKLPTKPFILKYHI